MWRLIIHLNYVMFDLHLTFAFIQNSLQLRISKKRQKANTVKQQQSTHRQTYLLALAKQRFANS